MSHLTKSKKNIKNANANTKANINSNDDINIELKTNEEILKNVEDTNFEKEKERDTEANLEKDYIHILNSYFNQCKNGHQLVRHQIDSYDYFIETLIPTIIKQFNPICVYYEYQKDANKYSYEFQLSFGEISVEPPMISENDGSFDEMTPAKARSRSLTYASNLRADLDVKIIHRTGDPDKLDNENVYTRKLIKVLLGKIPIMVQSKYCILSKYTHISHQKLGECRYDPGGYFIVNGNEKVIIAQERTANNMVNIFKNGNKPKTSFVNSCEIKSESDEFFGSIRNLSIKVRAKDNAIRVLANRFRIDLPLWAFFVALGIETDYDIINMIVYDINADENQEILNFLKSSVEDVRHSITEFKSDKMKQNVALDYLARNITYLGSPKDIRLTNDEKIVYLKKIIEEEFLPHVGADFRKKAYYLGYAVNRLIKNELNDNDLTAGDRDDYANKRIDSPGILMGSLFGQCFKALAKDMKKSIVKELKNNKNWKYENDVTEIININNISKLVKPNIIEGGLKYSLATGDWKVKSSKSKSRSGTAQVLSRLTYPSAISHLRRVNSPAEKNGKIIPPRKIHNSSWGYICPAETPEGASVGLVKNLSNGAIITKPSPPNIVIHHLENLKIPRITDVPIEDLYRQVKIFVNGDFYGVSYEPDILVPKLRSLRRQGLLNIYTSIFWQYQNKEIYINTDGGRLSRPLCIVDSPNKLRIKNHHIMKLKNKLIRWNNLIVPQINERFLNPRLNGLTEKQMCDYINEYQDLKEGVIEFIDCIESNNILVAANQKDLYESNNIGSDGIRKYQFQYSHCEITVGMMLGVLASCIPFSDHNQSPRNTYQSAQGKQAMGIYASNYALRLDTLAHILRYPQRPLVNTSFSKYFHGNKISNGINAIVCILTYTGYNQEDSVILSQSAVDRGLFASVFYRSYKDDEKKIQSSGQEEKFANPALIDDLTGEKKYDITIGKKREAYYKNLDERGFIKENVYVYPSDIIIGKIIPIRQQDRTINKVVYRDISTPIRMNEEGFVDKVYESRNSEGFRFCKVKIRSIRIPTIGDKFCLAGSCKVMTENGWVAIKDYDPNYKVLIFDPNSKTARYEYPLEKIIFKNDEETNEQNEAIETNKTSKNTMIEFVDEKSNFSIRVTPEHKLYVRKSGNRYYELVKAKELYDNKISFYMTNHGKYMKSSVFTYFNDMKYNNKYLAVLIGLWIKYGTKLDDDRKSLVFNFIQDDKGIEDDVQVHILEVLVKSCGHTIISAEEEAELAIKMKDNPTWSLTKKYQDIIRGFRRLIKALGLDPISSVLFKNINITIVNDIKNKNIDVNIYSKKYMDLIGDETNVSTSSIFFDESHLNDQMIEIKSEELYEMFKIYFGYLEKDKEKVKDKENIDTLDLPKIVYDFDWETSNILYDILNNSLKAPFIGGIIGSEAFKGLIPNSISRFNLERLRIHASKSPEYIYINLNPNSRNNRSRIIEDWKDIDGSSDVYCLKVSTGIFMVKDIDNININEEGENESKSKNESKSESKSKNKNNNIGIWTGNSSRHGQKGTCGMIYPEENMPRTKSGIVPNVIVNPHAIPSRMTVGHLIECITGKVACNLGGLGDATAFTSVKPEDIGRALSLQGYEDYGDEILYNRIDGSQMKTKIFVGPTFYQRLKHMVEDKIHSRSTGPVVMLTRQCSEGRARDGGLRIGEMERDGILCHGISVFLKERLMDMSDNYRVFVCDLCGVIANYNISTDKRTNVTYNVQECNYCNNHSAFSEVRIPFSCKLLIQELFAMGIVLRLIPE